MKSTGCRAILETLRVLDERTRRLDDDEQQVIAGALVAMAASLPHRPLSELDDPEAT